MMAQEINHRYHEVDCDDFMSFARVSALEHEISGLFEKALKNISKFDGLGKCTDEPQMYEPLVSFAYHFVL